MLPKWFRDSKSARPKPASQYAESSANDVSRLPLEVFMRLSKDPTTISQLPPDLLAKLPPGHISELPPELLAQLTALPPSTLTALSPETLSKLPPSAIANLPVNRLILLPPDTLARLPWSTIITLPPAALTRLPTSTLITLPPETLAKLSSNVLSTLPLRVQERLPPEILDVLKPTTSHPQYPTVSPPTDSIAHEQPPVPQQREQSTKGSPLLQRFASIASAAQGRNAPQEDLGKENHRHEANLQDPRQDDTKKSRDYILQKRASRRLLRRDSQGESQTALDDKPATTSQHSDTNPPRRSSSRRRSQVSAQPSQRSSPDPPLVVQNQHVGEPVDPPYRRTPTPSLGSGETRIPSSGSHRSITRKPSTRKSWFDNRTERATQPEPDGQNAARRPLSLDSRTQSTQQQRDMVRTNTQDQTPLQSQVINESQLHLSLRDREQTILELQKNFDNEHKQADWLRINLLETEAQLQRQADFYKGQLADVRASMVKEQAEQEQRVRVLSNTHNEELTTQRDELRKRIRELKVELLAQKSSHDQKMKDQRVLLENDVAKSRKQLDEVAASYEKKLELLKSDGLHRIAKREKEMSEKQEEYKTQQAQVLSQRQHEYKAQLQDVEKGLRGRVASLEAELRAKAQGYEQQIKMLQSQLKEQTEYYEDKMSHLTQKHSDEIQGLHQRYQTQAAKVEGDMMARMDALARKHDEQVYFERQKFKEDTHATTKNYQHALSQQKVEYEQTLDLLRTDGAGSARPPINLELIRNKFKNLKLGVQVITEPFNLGAVVIPENSHLDPTGFLQREKGMQRPLLRSLVWSRIMEGFFSAPFGFGVLGSGPGRAMLVDLFLNWRRVVAARRTGGVGSETRDPDSSIDLYELWHDREANKWRPTTFQSIMATMVRRDMERQTSDGTGEIDQTPYETNRTRVKDDILHVLSQATQGQVADEIGDMVTKVTCLAGELALQIGLHPGCLDFHIPDTGDMICIGQDFVDYPDGEAATGETMAVELVVCPWFFRIGDDRNDTTTRKSIFAGEIYPVRA